MDNIGDSEDFASNPLVWCTLEEAVPLVVAAGTQPARGHPLLFSRLVKQARRSFAPNLDRF